MNSLLKLSVFFLICIFSFKANSQSTTKPSVDQLNQIILQGQQRGMSSTELKLYAKSKGYSDAQINASILETSGMEGNKVRSKTIIDDKKQTELAQNL